MLPGSKTESKYRIVPRNSRVLCFRVRRGETAHVSPVLYSRGLRALSGLDIRQVGSSSRSNQLTKVRIGRDGRCGTRHSALVARTNNIQIGFLFLQY